MESYFIAWYEEPYSLANGSYQFIFSKEERENSLGTFESNGIDLAGDSWPLIMNLKEINDNQVDFIYDI